MAMGKNNNDGYYEAALKRRKSEAQKMMDLQKLKKGSPTIPKANKSVDFKNRTKTGKTKMKLVPVAPKQKKVELQRAMLKKNFLKNGKKK